MIDTGSDGDARIKISRSVSMEITDSPIAVAAPPTRAGSFRTIRLAIGPDASASYNVDAPHVVVRYRVAGTEWVLVK